MLDVAGERAGQAVLWIRGRDRAHAVRAPFSPTFYVRGAGLPRLAQGALDLGAVSADVVEAVPGLEDAAAKVLRVAVRGFEDVHRFASAIDAWGRYKDLDLYNVDLRPSQRILLARRLFPFAHVRAWGPERVSLLDDEQWIVDYPMPAMRTIFLDAGPDLPRGTLPTHEHPVAWATLQDVPGRFSPMEAQHQEHQGTRKDADAWCPGVPGVDPPSSQRIEAREEDVLRALADEVARRDPDVVLTRGGDRFLLPYLRHRADALGLTGWRLGRDDDPVRPARREKSYFTYGKIKYQPPAIRLAGRLHVDMASSFFYTEAGLHGLVDLSRIANIPLAEMARLGAGTAITAIQVDVAAREGRLIPWKKNQAEAFKTARTLLDADRGGYVFEPKVGLHEDVVELDFASLYPNLMVTRNLSPETVLCACCGGTQQGQQKQGRQQREKT
ncbi:MAG TPA: DNA polymerase domain-containing protein, partial [Candidatus Thermoplasmatota archaeon]|nr:DNA polymerase domain-containing protein [Candidatus Thermoplasmatota archaeon]